jgi:hypothetical protein
MKEVNYNENVVIPVLHKKCQDLLQANLALEVNLLVEQAKVRDISVQIQELEQKLQNLSKRKKKDEPTVDGESY